MLVPDSFNSLAHILNNGIRNGAFEVTNWAAPTKGRPSHNNSATYREALAKAIAAATRDLNALNDLHDAAIPAADIVSAEARPIR